MKGSITVHNVSEKVFTKVELLNDTCSLKIRALGFQDT